MSATGFSAPPMTFEAGGKQYVVILTGAEPGYRKTRHGPDPGTAGDAPADHDVRVRACSGHMPRNCHAPRKAEQSSNHRP